MVLPIINLLFTFINIVVFIDIFFVILTRGKIIGSGDGNLQDNNFSVYRRLLKDLLIVRTGIKNNYL